MHTSEENRVAKKMFKMLAVSPKRLFPYCTVKITHAEELTQMKTGRTDSIKDIGKNRHI